MPGLNLVTLAKHIVYHCQTLSVRGDILALTAGTVMPLAFAPYAVPWIAIPVLCVLFITLLNCSPQRAFIRGWLFGVAQFSISFYWIYTIFKFSDLSVTGALAVASIMMVYLAIFPAIGLWLAVYSAKGKRYLLLLGTLPAGWFFSEWLHTSISFGFPWMTLGYAQIDTVFSGYAPLIGALGISYLIALVSACVIMLFVEKKSHRFVVPLLVAIVVSGWLFKQITWTKPVGNPIQVSIIQGNILQETKWGEDIRIPTMQWYREQTLHQLDSDLIIWPETAIADSLQNATGFIEGLKHGIQNHNTDIMVGLIDGKIEDRNYRNAILNLKGGIYHKRHLLPFGEYFPWPHAPSWVQKYLKFPLSDFIPGPAQQELIFAAGNQIGSSICFEIAYPSEIRKSLPQANILVNISNDGPFRNSTEPYLHHQIARMRALEFGRYVLRAVNTGFSAIINPRGENIAISSLSRSEIIKGKAQPMAGETPYAAFENMPILILCFVVMVGFNFAKPVKIKKILVYIYSKMSQRELYDVTKQKD